MTYLFIIDTKEEHGFRDNVNDVFNITEMNETFKHFSFKIEGYCQHSIYRIIPKSFDFIKGYTAEVSTNKEAVLFKLNHDVFIEDKYEIKKIYENISINRFAKKYQFYNTILEKYKTIDECIKKIDILDESFVAEDYSTYRKILKIQDLLCEINTSEKIKNSNEKMKEIIDDFHLYLEQHSV